MIDVKATILQTLIKQFNKLRKLAVNEPAAFKKILHLIILDDMYDWGVYLGVDDCELKELAEMRKDYILCNSLFKMQDSCRMNPYVNVNLPQNNDTWKRVWDAPDVLEIDGSQVKPL